VASGREPPVATYQARRSGGGKRLAPPALRAYDISCGMPTPVSRTWPGNLRATLGAVFTAFRNAFRWVWGGAMQWNRHGFHGVSKRV